MNITAKANKDEIISSALELIDDQALRLDQFKQRQQLLLACVFSLLGLMFVF